MALSTIGHPRMAPPPSSSRRITALAYRPKRDSFEQIAPERISELLPDKGALLWLDLTAPQAEDIGMLRREFGLHPLAFEEILYEHPRPKCIEFPGFYMLVMYAVDPAADGAARFDEIILYIGERFLITTHRDPMPEVDDCIKRWQGELAISKESIAAPVYLLLDALLDAYFPLVDQMAERAENMEDALFAGNGMGNPPELFQLKKELLTMRRIVTGERDALNIVLRRDIPVFPENSMLFFQSLYDHLVRLAESVDTYRDLLSSAMDLHLSVISNRLNQVMKTLTVISTILMSASLIAGIYGMNFQYMPELHTRYGYYFALVGMALVAGGLAAYFRRIKWF